MSVRNAVLVIFVALLVAPGIASAQSADSTFRPNPDGFSFPNYGEAEPNLTVPEMRKLFGDAVCATAPADSCELTPAAKGWLEKENKGMNGDPVAMDGGHCMGFSVSALRFFVGESSPATFGAPTTFGLVLSPALRRDIAYGFVFQSLQAVNVKRIEGAPSVVLAALRTALDAAATPAGRQTAEAYTMAILKRGKPPSNQPFDGHAVTPFAINDLGNGAFDVQLYDNNFPGATRTMKINTANETWSYESAINPQATPDTYEGDATTRTLSLIPTRPGLGVQQCPFCGTETAAQAPQAAATAARASGQDPNDRVEVALAGNVLARADGQPDHGHLQVRSGNARTGYVGERVVNEIPGADIVRLLEDGGRPLVNREPRYQLPAGRAYTILLDNTTTDARDVEGVLLTGPDFSASVGGISLVPDQRVTLTLSADGTRLSVHSNRQIDDLTVRIARTETGADHSLTLSRLNPLAAGERLTAVLQRDVDRLALTGPAGRYDVALRYIDEFGDDLYVRQDVPTSSGRDDDDDEDDDDEQRLLIDYRAWDGDPSDTVTFRGDGFERRLVSQVPADTEEETLVPDAEETDDIG